MSQATVVKRSAKNLQLLNPAFMLSIGFEKIPGRVGCFRLSRMEVDIGAECAYWNLGALPRKVKTRFDVLEIMAVIGLKKETANFSNGY